MRKGANPRATPWRLGSTDPFDLKILSEPETGYLQGYMLEKIIIPGTVKHQVSEVSKLRPR